MLFCKTDRLIYINVVYSQPQLFHVPFTHTKSFRSKLNAADDRCLKGVRYSVIVY